MSMMTKRMIRPLLLVLPLLAVLAYGSPAPAAAQGGETLAAPTVTLTAVSACNPENPRTYLVASYTAVEGADSYQYRVKWGRSDSLGTWLDLPSHRQPGRNWPVRTNKSIEPGDVYVVQMRAVPEDGSFGAVGGARYSYSIGEFPAPTAVTASYATDDERQTDYSQAKLTWQGDSRSSGWFAVQQRAIGKRWQSGPWLQASTVGDAAGAPYYHDVSGLDVGRGYEFRVTGHTPQCEASPWSEVATLWPAPDPPSFETSVGRTKGGAMLGVWITDPQEGANHHMFRVGDAATVKMAAPEMQHRVNAQMGSAIEICVSAGNERGESAAECRAIIIKPDSPIADLRMEPSEQIPGSLSVYWTLKPVVNPTWSADDEGSTHSPPAYRVALRRVGIGPDRWPNEDTTFRTVYQEGQVGGAVFDGLEGNRDYEVAVQSNYYGETSFRYAQADTHMYPPSNLAIGFDDDDDGRAIVSWGPPRGGEQTGYTAVLRETHTGKRVGIKRPGREAVSAAFDGLKSGRWYHVTMRAVGLGNVRSTTTVCYFQHGVVGSQNRAGANTNVSGSGCAAN